MFHYEKKLQYPVKIKNANPKLASWIISQYGGPDTRRLRGKIKGYP
jgi:spore coat protein JC